MERLDILNRDVFVDQLVRLMDNISGNKASTCFAVNGIWGCGKSFVLDMFEEQLNIIQSEETFTNKYFVVRYNCWKYDYYEEPLVALVATMISAIEEKTKLFPDSKEKQEMLGVLKATGVSLLSMANTAVKEKTGVDLQTVYETVRDGTKEGAALYDSKHEYDVHFSFNKVLEKLASLLQDLAKQYTVVILVDELDRCLPEYAIKVLERLHHLTEGNSNLITAIAIDKEQLTSSVRQIFGYENPEKYLEKFFNFEVKLDCGEVSERISEKYTDYISLFDKDKVRFLEPVEECFQIIFRDIDIRTQEHLVKKATIAHKLLFNDKKDYSFMCMELLLSVLICIHDYPLQFGTRQVLGSSIEEIFKISRTKPEPSFVKPLTVKIENVSFRAIQKITADGVGYMLPDYESLYGAIAFSWYWMHKINNRYYIEYTANGVYEPISNNHEELKRFAETIFMMK